MRSRIVAGALVGALGLTGGALLAPSLASAETADGSGGVSSRLDSIKDALKGLVSDGTISQSQADRVATTLDEQLPRRGHGPGGHGRHGHGPFGGALAPASVAEVLGITVEELRTALQEGKTLAQVAQAEGISKDVLVDRLVAKAEEQLAEEVAAGRITQEQADRRKEGLEARLTEKVDQVGPGPRGHHRHHDGATPEPGSTTAPSSSPS